MKLIWQNKLPFTSVKYVNSFITQLQEKMEKTRRKGIMEKDTDSQHQLFAVAGSPYSGPSGGLVPDPYQITFEFLPKLNKI